MALKDAKPVYALTASDRLFSSMADLVEALREESVLGGVAGGDGSDDAAGGKRAHARVDVGGCVCVSARTCVCEEGVYALVCMFVQSRASNQYTKTRPRTHTHTPTLARTHTHAHTHTHSRTRTHAHAHADGDESGLGSEGSESAEKEKFDENYPKANLAFDMEDGTEAASAPTTPGAPSPSAQGANGSAANKKKEAAPTFSAGSAHPYP